MSTATLEIECAKPDCHWKGAPKDAPGHPCPTPEAEAAEPEAPQAGSELDPFAGIETQSGEPIPPIAADAEPTTREGLEAWLMAHGNYSGDGIPQDEKTARLDARLTGLADDDEPEIEDETVDPADVTVEPAAEETHVDAEPAETEPPLPGDEPDAAPAAPHSAIDLQGSGELVDGPTATGERYTADPWETQIAQALETQTGVAAYRWLVVATIDRGEGDLQAELIGRGRIKSDAQEIADKVAETGQMPGWELRVEKTQDVLEAADRHRAEIERLRENVDAPDETVTVDDEPAGDDEPAEPAEPAPDHANEGALLDRDAYLREDLALPKVDGQTLDRIEIRFSGSVMLDRSDARDVALYRRLMLGKRAELKIEGRVSGTGAKGATNKEGDLDVVVGSKTILIDSLMLPVDLTEGEEAPDA